MCPLYYGFITPSIKELILCIHYLARLMEEEDFLHDICLTVLFSSRAVRFAAILDASGKLIVGKYRKEFKAPRNLVSYLIITVAREITSSIWIICFLIL
jgi:hypothetical protein